MRFSRHPVLVSTARIGVAILCALIALPASRSYATVLSVEPDNFIAGTDLANSYPGVTLSVIGPNAVSVVSISGHITVGPSAGSNLATTGTSVFGQFPALGAIPTGQFWNEAEFGLLRADFASSTDFVSIDLIFDDDDVGLLRAFDLSGILLEEVSIFGDREALSVSISRSTPDIAFILAGGADREGLLLDNLQFNNLQPISEPETLLLFAFGLAGLMVAARRQFPTYQKKAVLKMRSGWRYCRGEEMNLYHSSGIAIAMLFVVLAPLTAYAIPVYHTTRTEFFGHVGVSITDDYTPYAPGEYVDGAMSAVLGETAYQSITFVDKNLVGDVFVRGDGSNYCAGCNGNFRLSFTSTSLSSGGGIFGLGIDIVLHSSRRVSIGDDDPSNPSYDGMVEVQFSDGSVDQILVPADIGYYEPSVYFLGLTDVRGISSITIGTEPTPQRHFWVIDNLTIATAPVSVREPASLALFGLGLVSLVGFGFTMRQQSSHDC